MNNLLPSDLLSFMPNKSWILAIENVIKKNSAWIYLKRTAGLSGEMVRKRNVSNFRSGSSSTVHLLLTHLFYYLPSLQVILLFYWIYAKIHISQIYLIKDIKNILYSSFFFFRPREGILLWLVYYSYCKADCSITGSLWYVILYA